MLSGEVVVDLASFRNIDILYLMSMFRNGGESRDQ